MRKEVEKKNRGRLAALEKRLKEVQRAAAKQKEAGRLQAGGLMRTSTRRTSKLPPPPYTQHVCGRVSPEGMPWVML